MNKKAELESIIANKGKAFIREVYKEKGNQVKYRDSYSIFACYKPDNNNLRIQNNFELRINDLIADYLLNPVFAELFRLKGSEIRINEETIEEKNETIENRKRSYEFIFEHEGVRYLVSYWKSNVPKNYKQLRELYDKKLIVYNCDDVFESEKKNVENLSIDEFLETYLEFDGDLVETFKNGIRNIVNDAYEKYGFVTV